MNYYIRLIALLLAIPALLFANIDDLPSIIQSILTDKMTNNVTVDSLNKRLIERTVWDTLNAMGLDILNDGYIVGLEIDFSFRDSHGALIDVTIQIVYDIQAIGNRHYEASIETLIRDRQNIVLSTTQQRMVKSFTLEIDNSLIIAETEMQGDIDTAETNEIIEETSGRRQGVFLVVENGVHQGYSYRDIEARAFENRRLTDMNLPEGIQTIGSRAFANNRLSVINIPHSVTTIEASAFVNNRVTIVSIGDNVQLGKNAIGRGFETFYNRNGRKAGFYVYERGNWSWGLLSIDN